MRTPVKRLLVPPIVTGLAAGIFLTTPDLIIQAIGSIMSFAVSLLLLLLFVRLAPLENWRRSMQKVAIWLIAAFGAYAPHAWLFFK